MEEIQELRQTRSSTNTRTVLIEQKSIEAKEPLLARAISIILHPFFMGVYGVSLLFVYTDFNILFLGQFFRFLSPVFFCTCLLAPLLLIAIGGIINSFWKISAHMMGIGGLIGCTLSVCYNVKGTNPYVLFIILFILAGCLGVSRLILKRHTPAQVYSGFLVGLAVSYLCVWMGTYWGYLILIRNL